MPSFVDIAPLRETVTVRGLEFEVRGVGLEDLAVILHRFPELAGLLPKATAPGAPAPVVDVRSIIALGPQIVAWLIACATGKAGDEKEEKALLGLALGEQVAFIEAIVRLSLPGGGLTPLIATFTRMMQGADDGALANGAAGKVPDTKSPLPSTD